MQPQVCKRVQEVWGVEVLRGPRNVLVMTAFSWVWGWEVRQGFAVFLGQLHNPRGCWLCWVQSLGIDFSALPLLLCPLPPPPLLLLSYILLFFPFSFSG